LTKNIIITGGAGFIGSHLVNFFLKTNNKVFVIDDLTTGSIKNLNLKYKNIKFIKGDCTKDKILDQLPKMQFDILYHIAGQSSGEISFENPLNDFNRNLLSTLKLCQFCINRKIKKIVYASSMSVYGDLKKKYYKANEILNCDPLSFYGVSKLCSEFYLKQFSKLGLKYTILRLFNVYGPNQNFKNLKQGMISIYLGQLLKSNKIFVKGKLNRFRDFIYIDDVVKILTSCLKNPRTNNKIYNISTGKKTFIKKILYLIKKYSKKKFKIIQKKSTPGDQFGIYSIPKKVKNDFKIKKFIKINDGLKKMINSINQ
jgi:UDP-glucose 4-epimerase